LLALTGAEKEPVSVGVPEISPVDAETINPVGKPVAV
jgi:hypothetical protein